MFIEAIAKVASKAKSANSAIIALKRAGIREGDPILDSLIKERNGLIILHRFLTKDEAQVEEEDPLTGIWKDNFESAEKFNMETATF